MRSLLYICEPFDIVMYNRMEVEPASTQYISDEVNKAAAITDSTATKKYSKRVFFEILEKVGPIGRYQKVTLIFWCLCCHLAGGLEFITPYIFF
jgi:hypothetical protein